MNIIILDDYQDAVRKLRCAVKLDKLNAKVFTNTVKGIGQLSVRLRDAEVLVLIRERTHFPKQLLEKLPKLKLIAQTGRAPMVKMSRTMPPTPVAAPWNGSTALGWLWDSILKAMARRSPTSTMPAFSSPAPTRILGDFVGKVFSSGRVFL